MSEDASRLMGPLLLKGWAMGPGSCEIDFNPFMVDMKNKASLCVSCESKLAKLIIDGAMIVKEDTCFYVVNAALEIK